MTESIAYSISVFISTLFLLEIGADNFVDHTAIVARRINVSQSIVALLTAGAEWEELGVVIASLLQHRQSLAIGNVVGSAIANILGAFSLGLLFHPAGVDFDRSSRVYTLLLLVLTSVALPVLHVSSRLAWLIGGGVLIAVFVAYVASVAWAIAHGRLTAPAESDDDDSSNEGDDDSFHEAGLDEDPTETTTFLASSRAGGESPGATGHSLLYHVGRLVFGFLAISLSGYLLSHSATALADALGMSAVLFGVVFLAFATTLPEKFVAVLSGSKGHVGILVANTVGSNIFLLSLCLGIVMVQTGGDFDQGSINLAESLTLWATTAALTGTVWFGGRWARWIGVGMLAAYFGFLVAEFSVIKHQ